MPPFRRTSMKIWLTTLSLTIAISLPMFAGDAPTWNDTVKKASALLKSSQDTKGGWSTDKTPGVTGVCLTGLLRTGAVSPKDPIAEKALAYIESLVNPEKKHIAGKGDAKVQ